MSCADDGRCEQPSDDLPVVVLGACAAGASVAAWCDEVRLLLVDGSHAVVRCDVHAIAGRAADVLDALARLQLTARRHGGEIHLHGADAALIAILELVGFDQLVHGGAGPSGPDRDDA